MSSNHKIERHTWGLREALFREWEGLRSGSVSVSRAKASAALAAAILKSVEIEVKVVNHMNEAKPGDVKAIAQEIRLGRA